MQNDFEKSANFFFINYINKVYNNFKLTYVLQARFLNSVTLTFTIQVNQIQNFDGITTIKQFLYTFFNLLNIPAIILKIKQLNDNTNQKPELEKLLHFNIFQKQ